jgi:eukaryotic-like serine/threonine-protein kinase
MTNDVPQADDDRRPNSPARRIDAACDRFETAWRGGQEPRIEDLLEMATEADRPALLRELITLEVELRRGRGEDPRSDEYRDRFPGQSTVVDAVLGVTILSPESHRRRPSPTRDSTSRSLLLGLLALQNSFIDRDALLAAFATWVADRSRALGQILLDREALSPSRHMLLEALVTEHLRLHDDDPEQSLAALSSIGSVRHDLDRLGDADLQASLAATAPRVPDDGEATATYNTFSSRRASERFRIIRFHREGGLGRVYVARDEELGREVALKEIRSDKDAADLRSRFVLEAEINGGLEHPGIVPVYSLGSYGDGRPFYAMRFVRGDSLKEAIDAFHRRVGSARQTSTDGLGTAGKTNQESADGVGTVGHAHPTDAGRRSLGLRKLLRRFTDVCNAIAYAHSRGVLHRDIKPGNILLGPYGETLVVDWGLAKIIGRAEAGAGDPGAESTPRPPSASGTGETVPGTALGTPAYMSPEQAEGRLDLLGPRSDVYSLGATLYVVLTGRAPFDGSDAAEVLLKVQRGEFAIPRAVDASIPKPLDAICLKAMALKQADRYASPRALADDIEHWLADEPVMAYPDPWPDRARRWSRKHRTLVACALAVVVLGLLGSVGFAAVVTAKNRELARQTQRAVAREQMAIDAVKRFRDVVVEEPVLKNNPALEALRKKLLNEPLAFFRSFREQLQADKETNPDALARLASAAHDYAHLTQEIGDIEDGLRSHVESLAIWQELVRDHPAKPNYWRGLAAIEHCRGNMLSATGHSEEAMESYAKALAIWERLARENPGVTEFQRELAVSHNGIGNLKSATGRPAEALESYGKALAIWDRLERENPSVTEFQSGLTLSHFNTGNLQSKMGRPDQALESYGKALAIRDRLARENPSVTRFQSDLAISHHSIGVLQSETGHPDQALESYAKALAIRERLARENPSVTGFQSDLARSHFNIGNRQRATDHPDQALESYAKALAIQERLARENPSVTQFQRDLALSHNNIGVVQKETGRPDQALKSYGNALAIRERVARENPSVTELQDDLAASHNNIGNLQLAMGHPDQALESQAKAMEIRERLARAHPESPDYASQLGGTLNNMALIDLNAKRFRQARDRFQQAISWQEKALAANPRHPTYRQFLRNHQRNLVRAAKGLGNDEEVRAARRELDQLEANDPATAALDQRLAAVIRGDAPKDNRERLQLARRAYEKRLHAASTRLYREALDADPKLADSRLPPHRYNAACAAALAACAKTTLSVPSPTKGAEKTVTRTAQGGEPGEIETSSPHVGPHSAGAAAPPLAGAERAKLRDQARNWLEAELAAWTKLLASANRQQRQAIAGTLKHWQQDADLAGVRDQASLAELPKDEGEAWKSLWTNVDALLVKARTP